MNSSEKSRIVAYSSIVGSVVARRRAELGVDQTALATAIGMTQSSWSRIECGISAFPVELLARVARVLRVTPHEILEAAERQVSLLKAVGVPVVFVRPTRQRRHSHSDLIAAAREVAPLALKALRDMKDKK